MSRATKHHKTNAVIDGLIRQSTLENPFTMKGLLLHPDIIAIDPPRWMVNERIKAFKHKNLLKSVTGAGVPRGSYYYGGGSADVATIKEAKDVDDFPASVEPSERDYDLSDPDESTPVSETSVASTSAVDSAAVLSAVEEGAEQKQNSNIMNTPSATSGVSEDGPNSIIQELQSKNDELVAKVHRLEAQLAGIADAGMNLLKVMSSTDSSNSTRGTSVATAPSAVEDGFPGVDGEGDVAGEGSQTRLTFDFGTVRVTMEQVNFSHGLVK